MIVHTQVGTSSVVYPAAGFAPMLAMRGVPVAEFNMEETPCTGEFRYTVINNGSFSVICNKMIKTKWQKNLILRR